MLTLNSITVERLLGKRTLKAKFHPDVTVLIGPNGSGKTTLLNILQAALTVDVALLGKTDFSELRLDLEDGNRHLQVTITQHGEMPPDVIRYQVGQESFELPTGNRYAVQTRQARKTMADLVSASLPCIHRGILVEEDSEPAGRGSHVDADIDRRLAGLMEQLTAYELALHAEVGRMAAAFQRDVMSCILYDPQLDSFSPADLAAIDLGDVGNRLSDAYQDGNDEALKRVDAHLAKLGQSVEKLKGSEGEKHAVDDIIPIALLRRTTRIAELSSQFDGARKVAFGLLDQYLGLLNSFMPGRQVASSVEAGGGLDLANGVEKTASEFLSFGEKQLIIFLTEALLQRRQSSVVISDEPEHSLHIEWQRKLLGAIRELNDRAQVIVATHSPEIAGMWARNIVDMGDILA